MSELSPDGDSLSEDETPQPAGPLPKRNGDTGHVLGAVVRWGEKETVVLNNRRFRLAFFSLVALTLLALMALVMVWCIDESRFGELRELFPLLFTPLVTLVSTSFAWYFATESAQRHSDDRR